MTIEDDPTQPRVVLVAPQEPPWMAYAKGKIGVHELAGSQDNAYIVQILRACGLSDQHDETAWCSAFLNDCMAVGAHVAGTGRANARSWLHWGQEIATPRYGCVVVLSRPPDPAHGHVGLYAGEHGAVIEILGGNENNQVMIKDYPRDRLLSYRWPIGIDLPTA